NKPTGVSRPCRTASERVVTAVADRPGVATSNKGAACSNDVGKRATGDADLQHAAVKKAWWARLQVEIIPERQLRRGGHDRNDGRIHSLVTDSTGIVYPRRIGQRICNRGRHSGI